MTGIWVGNAKPLHEKQFLAEFSCIELKRWNCAFITHNDSTSSNTRARVIQAFNTISLAVVSFGFGTAHDMMANDFASRSSSDFQHYLAVRNRMKKGKVFSFCKR